MPTTLAYKDRFVQEIVQTNELVGGCEGGTPQVVSGEDNLIIIRVSYEEWIKIWSSVVTGADVCYPSESDAVRWSLIRNLECPMDKCELVASAIDECVDVQDAIARAVLSNEDLRREIQRVDTLGAPFSSEQNGYNLITDCDNDIVFAEVTALVDQLDTNNIDFLQILGSTTVPAQRLIQLFKAIPLLETLPIDEIADYIVKMYTEIVNNYNAQWTTALYDEYRCDLFCFAIDNPDCSLTYDNLMQYFEGRLGASIQPDQLVLSMVQYTTTGTWSGSAVIDIMMLNQIVMWKAAGEWLGLNFRSLQGVMALGANYPDSDWEILCEDCAPPTPEGCFDLRYNAEGWYASLLNGTPTPTFGRWVDGEGLAPAGGAYTPPADKQFFFTRPENEGDPVVRSLEFKFSEPATGFQLARQGGAPIQYSGTPVTTIKFSELTNPLFFPLNLELEAIVITFSPYQHAPSANFRLEEFCWEEEVSP